MCHFQDHSSHFYASRIIFLFPARATMKFLSALNNCQTAENGGINILPKYNWETHLKETFSAYFYFPPL